MGNIFISYRRQDAPKQAGAIHRLLTEHFSEASVFFDVSERLEPGEDFTQVLEDRIASADAALFVIGPNWNPRSSGRLRRLDDADDYVRLELATALMSSASVIPVLVADAAMPRPRDLPADLRKLSRNEAFVLPQRGFKAAAARLVRKLDELQTVSLEADSGSSAGANGLLRLSIVDASGLPIASAARLVLRSEDSGHVQEFSAPTLSRRVVIKGLSDRPGNRYILDVKIPSRRVVRWVVTAVPWKSAAVTRIHVPLDPDRVRKTVFPSFKNVPAGVRDLCGVSAENQRSAKETYQTMDALQRANLLNCHARASAFALAEGLTLAQLLESTSARLLDARADRLFLRIGNDAAARLTASFKNGPFEPVPAALHAPPPGYQLAQSGKTHDPLLSFQVTLFKGDADHVLEMEFDNIQAMLCVFRAIDDRRDLGNLGRTHPYDVHQLLIRYQHVDPGYELRS